MNRMHPQDLRAIVAGMFAQRLSITESIEDANVLLAELERAAQPFENIEELEPANPEPATGCQRSHPHEDPCEHHDFRTEIARLNNLCARIEAERDALKAKLDASIQGQKDGHLWPSTVVWSSETMPGGDPARMAVTPDWVIEDIKQAERERIIAMLSPEEPNGLQVVSFQHNARGMMIDARTLRAALEPKPAVGWEK